MVQPLELVVEKITVERGSRTIISDLSLTVASGQAVLLTGANGAGKTTLMRAIAGLLTPSAGAIRLNGGSGEEVALQAHYVGHLNAVKASLTVSENLHFYGEYLLDQRDRDAALPLKFALEKLDLEALANIPAAYLSAGQKRRVGLARVLMAERPVWLLDEPTASLDAASAAIVASLVDGHTARGGIAVIATHYPLALNAPRTLHLAHKTAAEAA